MVRNFFVAYGGLALAYGVIKLARGNGFDALLLFALPILAFAFALAFRNMTGKAQPATEPSAATPTGATKVEFQSPDSQSSHSQSSQSQSEAASAAPPLPGADLSKPVTCPECSFTVGSGVTSCAKCGWARPMQTVTSAG